MLASAILSPIQPDTTDADTISAISHNGYCVLAYILIEAIDMKSHHYCYLTGRGMPASFDAVCRVGEGESDGSNGRIFEMHRDY